MRKFFTIGGLVTTFTAGTLAGGLLLGTAFAAGSSTSQTTTTTAVTQQVTGGADQQVTSGPNTVADTGEQTKGAEEAKLSAGHEADTGSDLGPNVQQGGQSGVQETGQH